MRFSAPSSADEYGVALAREEAAGMEVTDQRFVDRRAGEAEVLNGLGQRQSGGAHLVADRSRPLLGHLGLQQGTEHLIERVLAPEAVGNDLVEGGAHPGELERRHQLQQLMPLHATLLRPASVAARRNGRSRRLARRSAVMLPGWRSAPAAVASAVVPGC